MKKFLVIGNPINHSLSPKLHNFWIKQNKLEAVYEKKLVSKNGPDAVLFKHDEEKELFERINAIRKAFTVKQEKKNYEDHLKLLSETKLSTDKFFDNVKVNEDNETLRKNRLELINMLCKTFQNYINFRFLKAHNE